MHSADDLVYETYCSRCEREFLTRPSQSMRHKARCGYCYCKDKLERLNHPEDRAEARLELSRWVIQQGAYLRMYAERAFEVMATTEDGAPLVPVDAGDDDVPF
jgi:hypothetical protein